MQDLQLVPLVFDVSQLALTRDEARLLVQLLDVIHAHAQPATGGAHAPEGDDGGL